MRGGGCAHTTAKYSSVLARGNASAVDLERQNGACKAAYTACCHLDVPALPACPCPAPQNLGDLSGWDPASGAPPPQLNSKAVTKLMKKNKVVDGWGTESLGLQSLKLLPV